VNTAPGAKHDKLPNGESQILEEGAHYSLRKASIGSSRAARRAGR
jgi:hypothetical protein